MKDEHMKTNEDCGERMTPKIQLNKRSKISEINVLN